MPPAAALQIAWNRLALGRFNLRRGVSYIGSECVSPATITSTVDAVLGIRARDDVDPEEKKALGRALLSVLVQASPLHRRAGRRPARRRGDARSAGGEPNTPASRCVPRLASGSPPRARWRRARRAPAARACASA
ncbi:hypothetical protein BE08_34460 [Sorangium cellulosum]|uniref:Uncharacterized protein n=1 Tax=Sorangium cellulosum TaxID=56 RepID=A0A150PF09_SORCE|nr:hypothetical protein BE08_34460 [Sorangium cellulosum]